MRVVHWQKTASCITNFLRRPRNPEVFPTWLLIHQNRSSFSNPQSYLWHRNRKSAKAKLYHTFRSQFLCHTKCGLCIDKKTASSTTNFPRRPPNPEILPTWLPIHQNRPSFSSPQSYVWDRIENVQEQSCTTHIEVHLCVIWNAGCVWTKNCKLYN